MQVEYLNHKSFSKSTFSILYVIHNITRFLAVMNGIIVPPKIKYVLGGKNGQITNQRYSRNNWISV